VLGTSASASASASARSADLQWRQVGNRKGDCGLRRYLATMLNKD
jgi:hypothetical protein